MKRLDATATALVFDVEGTLIDCVPQTLACWQGTLKEFDHTVELKALQAYAGWMAGTC